MNRRFLVWCILVCIAFFSACRNSENNVEADDEAAQSPRILDEPPFEALTDSISDFPSDGSLYFKRAQLLSEHELHRLAFHDYQKAWKAIPSETTAYAFISNLFVTGKEKEAISMLKACVKQYPDNPDFQRRLSEAYLQSGDTEKALESFDNILRQDSGNFEAWYEKGVMLSQIKDTTNAIKALEKAYALQPLQSYGIYLANLYAESKDSKTLPLCNDLLKKDTLGELTDALFVKGIYFTNINQNDKALELFESCIRQDWKFTEAYIEKGIILYNERNIDEALKTFSLAAKVSNTYADAYYWMGRCFETIGKMREAKANYYKAIALDRNFTEARDALNRLSKG